MNMLWLIIITLLSSEVSAAIPRNPSVQVPLEVSAVLDINQAVSPGISVAMNQNQVFLNWNNVDKSFVNAQFRYNVYLDADQSAASRAKYKVGLRDVNLICSTKQGQYLYRNINANRVNGFGDVSVVWQDGSQTSITTVGQAGDVTSPANGMHLMFSPEFNREVPGSSGTIQFQFPLLDRELEDSGADCIGGALLMFYGEL